MSTAAKLFNKVLLNRIRILDNSRLPVQCGFRRNRGTVEQILAVRLIIDRCRTKKREQPLFLSTSAKPSTQSTAKHCDKYFLLYGVPERLVISVMALYVGTSSAVWLDNNTTNDSFPTTTGVIMWTLWMGVGVHFRYCAPVIYNCRVHLRQCTRLSAIAVLYT